MAIELPDGSIVTGRSGELLTASAAAVLNSVKEMAGIRDEMLLMSPVVLEPIIKMKTDILRSKQKILSLTDVLLALSICAATNPVAALAVTKLKQLKNCEAHASCMLTSADDNALRSLGMNVTCEAEYPTSDLYYV